MKEFTWYLKKFLEEFILVFFVNIIINVNTKDKIKKNMGDKIWK